MSFSSDVREELARVVPRRRCCRKAELIGLFKSCGSLTIGQGGTTISIGAESASVARKAFLYLKQLYSLQAQLMVRRQRRLRSSNFYVVRVISSSAVSSSVISSIVEDLGLMEPASALLQRVCDDRGPKCCAKSFLRGLFLGAGSITAPGKGHHMEIIVGDTHTAQQVVDLLHRFGISMKISTRKGGPLVYSKQGQDIADFLNLLGAHASLMQFENVRAYKTIRSRVNRIVNMETANLTKIARAAARQVEDILLIEKRLGLDALPESLEEMARLRLSHPDASLEELGEMLNSSVTKSGINHRVRRLSMIARELRQGSVREEKQS